MIAALFVAKGGTYFGLPNVASGETRPRLGKKAAAATPIAFRDLLIGIAESVRA